jgi:hypothetical protein
MVHATDLIEQGVLDVGEQQLLVLLLVMQAERRPARRLPSGASPSRRAAGRCHARVDRSRR